MTDPQSHIREIRQRRKESHQDVLDSLAGAIDRLEKAFPGQWHFLMEFIQNADDAQSTSLSIEISRNEIRILNDGRPFDQADVESICKVGRSSKTYTEKGEDYIGYLGVGFKSVFLISDNPQIYSGNYRFEFNKNAWDQPDETPWQIYPLWIEDGTQNIVKDGYTTGFRIPLSESVDDDMFEKLIDEVSAEQVSDRTLLFLRKLEKIEITDRVQGVTKKINKNKTAAESEYEKYKFEVYEDGELEKTNDWLVFRSTATIPDDIKTHQLTQRWERDGLNTREVMVGFRLDENGELTKEEGTAHMGVFSFLPLKEVPSELNFLVQADFLTAPGREVIHREAPWNEWLAEEVYNLIIDNVIPAFKADSRWKYNFTTILYPGDGGHEIFDEQIHQPLQKYLQSNPVLIDQYGDLTKAENAVKVNAPIYNLVTRSDLDQLYPEMNILHQDCETHWKLSRQAEDGPSYNANKGLRNGMLELLKLKAVQGDIEFFKSFYESIGDYAESTLSSSPLRRQDIVLTQDKELASPGDVFLRNSSVEVPSELEDRFKLIHEDLVATDIISALKVLGLQQLTQDRLQKALNADELPNIRDSWDEFSDQKRIEKTQLCKTLWEENQATKGELEFLTIKTKSGKWIDPADAVLPKEYKPDHGIERLASDGLIDIDLRFVSTDYLSDSDNDADGWRGFLHDLGIEDNLNKSNISEQVAVETALRFEEENGREAEALAKHEETGGYDIRSESRLGERLIEAKGRQRPSPSIQLTPTQFEHLQKEGENYYIYVVRDSLNNPTLSVIKGEKILDVERSISIDFNEWRDLGSEEYHPTS